jgi:acyl-CoA thioesterase FadM
MVMIDAGTRKAQALPDEVIARLERLRLREP